MKRLTVSLDDDVFGRLHERARQHGVSMNVVAREAIERQVAPTQPLPRSIGIGNSGHTKTAQLASDPPPYRGPRDDPFEGTRPRLRSLGIGASGETDIARRIGDEEFHPDHACGSGGQS